MWQTELSADPFALDGDRLLAWDHGRGGLVEIDATSGRERRFRTLGGLGISGVP
jgi:hypothetical protein